MHLILPEALDLARKWQTEAVTIYAIMMSDSFRWDMHYAGRVSVTEEMIVLTPENAEPVAHMTLMPHMIITYGNGILTIAMPGWRCYLRAGD